MRNIRMRNVGFAMLVAVGLVIGLGLALAIMIVLLRGAEDTDENGDDSGPATDCLFLSQTDPVILYHAPVSAPSQQKTSIEGGTSAPIIRQNRGYYLLQVNNEITGWVNSRRGVVEGDCDEIPIDETPLVAFPTVCIFTTDQESTLYSGPDLLNPSGTLSPGTYVVESVNGDGYLLYFENDVGGWVLGTDGEFSGNCGPIGLTE